jgi:Na+-transporting NADH:ubiquinone oxidoreductase subunit C
VSRNSTGYIIFFASMVTLIAGVALAVIATVLKPMQERNVEIEKKMFILTTVGFEGKTAIEIEEAYAKYITPLVVDRNGNQVTGVDAFQINPVVQSRALEKDPDADVVLPVYTYTADDGEKAYIFPMNGIGLWGPVWGYIALGADFNVVKGIIFDHKAETPGLGAEITGSVFRQSFLNKKIYSDDRKELRSILVLKGTGNVVDEHSVDGIAGSTITAQGVQRMLKRTLETYEPFFITVLNEN